MTARWMTRWNAAVGFEILVIPGNEVVQFVIDIIGHGARQLGKVHIAGAHDTACILIIDQREEQMLQRRILMMVLVRNCQRLMEGPLQTR